MLRHSNERKTCGLQSNTAEGMGSEGKIQQADEEKRIGILVGGCAVDSYG